MTFEVGDIVTYYTPDDGKTEVGNKITNWRDKIGKH